MIRKRSKKRAKQEREYSKRVKVWKEENPLCQANVTGCTKHTDDCHHKRGRVEQLLLNEIFWLPVCRSCHNWIESNPEEAKRRGLSLSRLAKVDVSPKIKIE